MTRSQARLATRERLISAAGARAARDGIRSASVQAIAAEAGVTTGALYSNFSGKAALLDAVVASTLRQRMVADKEHFLGEGNRSLRERADGWVGGWGRSQSDVLLFFELWAEGVRDPAVRPRVAAAWHELRRTVRGAIEAEAKRVGVRLPRAAADDLAMVTLAMAHGIAMERALTPRSVPDGILGLALSLLFRALGAGTARD